MSRYKECVIESFFYFSTKIYVVGTEKNNLNEMVLLSTQKTCLTLYSIIAPFKYHAFENIMEKGAFALLEQDAPFSIIFSKVFKT